MASVQISITSEKITATPVGFDKNIKNQFASFGGAQKPWKWDGSQWTMDGAEKVEYWAGKVKTMFSSWKNDPSETIDHR